ncbi:hypothetical protein AGDE_09297 [Angomonas deanei]|nr:hypothetical protein AGDE_09297 [Angomonas deanei]|eukprot:EPY30725.1 hypothetical protein AGDE_09297 [Angomonas deanei]
MSASIFLQGINQRLLEFDVCDTVANALKDGLKDEPLAVSPPLAATGSKLSSSLYFRNLQAKSRLWTLMGVSSSVEFVSDTSMRINVGSIVDLKADVDTAKFSTSFGARILGKLINTAYNLVKDALNLPDLNNFLSTTISTSTKENITVSVTDGDSFLEDLLQNEAQLVASTYIPKSASLSFDVVADDMRCRFFGVVCTVPAESGLKVTNTRFHGLGDADAIASKLLTPFLEGILNDVVMDVMTLKATESKGRVTLRTL